jgi:hypothetical protein
MPCLAVDTPLRPERIVLVSFFVRKTLWQFRGLLLKVTLHPHDLIDVGRDFFSSQINSKGDMTYETPFRRHRGNRPDSRY